MGEQTKNMFIGLFVIATCAVIIWLILFLKPTVGDGKETLYVRFSNINQINVGTRVLFAGKAVGEVAQIQDIYDARQKPLSDVLGEIYYYQLVLKIDSNVKVYDTDTVTVQTSGLLGEKSIAIIPKNPPKGVVPQLVTNQPIYAQSVDPIERAFTELSNLSQEMKKTFNFASSWIQKNGPALGDTIRSFGSTMEEIKITVNNINQKKLVDDIQTSINQFTATALSIESSVKELQANKAFANAGIMIDNLKTASKNVNLITTDIAEGKGSIGRLIKGDDFYLRLSAVLSKADTVMNDINHYGILFNLNKTWQRQRAKQITALHALNTPKDFKKYFETEISEINTAMSRISMLIEKAEKSPTKEKILNNPAFRKDFRELLQQAHSLSNNLKMYNEQLTETAGP